MLGKGELTLEDISNALQISDNKTQLGYVAPASGLNLHSISYEDDIK